MSWVQKTSKKMLMKKMRRMLTKTRTRWTIPTVKATPICKSVARAGRRMDPDWLAGWLLSALMLAAGTIADAAQLSWTSAVRHGRVDLAEVCCTADSQLAGEVIIKGGTAHRYSHWNGYDLTTRKGTEALRSGLESTRPRWIWMSPPCGPDSPMQNLNQRNDKQILRYFFFYLCRL